MQVLSIVEHTQCSLVQMRVHLKVAVKKYYKYLFVVNMERKFFKQQSMASKKRQSSKRQKRAAAEPTSPVQHSDPDYQESEEND